MSEKERVEVEWARLDWSSLAPQHGHCTILLFHAWKNFWNCDNGNQFQLELFLLTWATELPGLVLATCIPAMTGMAAREREARPQPSRWHQPGYSYSPLL